MNLQQLSTKSQKLLQLLAFNASDIYYFHYIQWHHHVMYKPKFYKRINNKEISKIQWDFAFSWQSNVFAFSETTRHKVATMKDGQSWVMDATRWLAWDMRILSLRWFQSQWMQRQTFLQWKHTLVQRIVGNIPLQGMKGSLKWIRRGLLLSSKSSPNEIKLAKVFQHCLVCSYTRRRKEWKGNGGWQEL